MHISDCSEQWVNTDSNKELVLTLTCPSCKRACILRENEDKCSVCGAKIKRSDLNIIELGRCNAD